MVSIVRTTPKMKRIQKILVANRGEIALRVMRSAREMGIATVAVYSEADAQALHVRYADEAVCIGPPPSSQSYLNIPKLLEACRMTAADAVHPGYGFLSENAAFAEAVTQAGITFIGPSAASIRVMGDKLSSKQAVKDFGVPLVPGMDEPISDVAYAKSVADSIGYPVMIKASAGGGGKGMRVVSDPSDFEEQMTRAVSEARNSFGDEAVFVEKFITNPKHIEVQVLGDQHGHIVYLFERECSIQRRNQKVIEEAPSAVLTATHRQKIGEAAVNVARSCGYFGAGTVEFIVDEQLNFYFLEMNTRLQVEHPVTEAITGLDLVKEQIRIAQGEPLDFAQNELHIHGHAIEVRVYAEDPSNNFLPDTGRLLRYVRPQGPGVRVDDGFEEGMEIPIHYDPMIAKLITWGSDRHEAMERMKRAIDEYTIVGVKTTLPFCRMVLDHPAFRDGSFTTKFVENHFQPEMLETEITKELADVAAIFTFELEREKQRRISLPASGGHSEWKKKRNS